MNKHEQRMLEILKQGKNELGYVGVKAEFEAEGTRTDELLRLLELARKAGLNVGLKIGGCEAVRDLIESKQFGCEYIIAPMVETPYALSKYIDAKDKVYSSEEQLYTSFLFNIETRAAFDCREEMFQIAKKHGSGVDGVVFGRVDYCMSMGAGREKINTPEISDDVKVIAEMCSANALELVAGGGVSIEAVEELTSIKSVHLNRFETRKIIFDANCLGAVDTTKALINAVEFELLWLKNKREYYSTIFREDDHRIDMLGSRWNELIEGK
jgi:hypothetical protein